MAEAMSGGRLGMTAALRDEFLAVLHGLPEENLRALLHVLRQMRDDKRPIRRWSPAIGSISDRDTEEMRRAVEEECEGVGPAGQWSRRGHE
jgi:hypothetical protein